MLAECAEKHYISITMSNLHIFNIFYALSFLAATLIVRRTLTANAALALRHKRLQSLMALHLLKLR